MEEKSTPQEEPSQILIDNGCIADFYDLPHAVMAFRDGGYGVMHKATKKSSAQQVGVKKISKSRVMRERFEAEISIMKSLSHPNINQLFETFQDERNFFMVLELCLGDDLFNAIIDRGKFSEIGAKHCMRQIFQGVGYCHERRICLCDLTLEKIMLLTQEPIEQATLKIVDFGSATDFRDNEPMTIDVGTPNYVAPEVLAGRYDSKCDLWSCGVAMYIMLCGYPPFYDESDAEVLAKVRLGDFSFAAADWTGTSDDAKSLIGMLLKMNPTDRLGATAALQSTW
eukprot:CAMPEP_0197632012 /NCGR_PEP_ID=MMETSP1338-20131121/8966_1 /TAXON_ID=43686 ORGANISM="Pelagodinium beii, Strain RCC1491" /NCGR_SAMPLE_ID=MMETSP1338 /ASSEMBLY_ACC=CAM_ASM_000754 /LENGTH=282 /DNA_ID=CAMNT_0043203559 /DNA_START=92 /DNA_END=937 /DNA_ORIENTATION=-